MTRRRTDRTGSRVIGIFALLAVTASLLLPSVVPEGGAASPDAARVAVEPAHAALAPATDPLTITSFVAVPNSISLGKYTYLTVTVSGGAPPYNYTYGNLPPGCVTQNMTPLLCHPISAQHYLVTVVVNDSAHASVSATTPFNVSTGFGGTPIINSFYVTPATAPVYTKFHLLANASSRSSDPSVSLNYLFEDLPPGCASFNSTDLECVPTAAGAYKVALVVTDSFGQFSVGYAYFNVTGASASPSGSPLGGLGTMWVILAVLVLVVAVILMLRTKRKSPPPESVRPWSP